LKSESEERETWTAESLRAASHGEAILYWSGFGRDIGGSRLRYIADRFRFARKRGVKDDQWVDLVNVTTLTSVVTAQT